jgi:hypothetical protein
VAVHKHDAALLEQVNRSILKLHPKIDHVLAQYGVPTVPRGGGEQ